MTPSIAASRYSPPIVVAAWAVAAGAQLIANRASTDEVASPMVTFWFVILATALCLFLAVALLVRGARDQTAETTMLGSFLFAVSALPLVHGLLTPGVLYGPNDGSALAALVAVPVGAIVLVPWVAPDTRWANAMVRCWRSLVVTHVGLVLALCTAFLVAPRLVSFPVGNGFVRGSLIALSVSACAVASWRHVSLAMISQRMGSVGIAIGFALIGSAPLMFLGPLPSGIGFWLAHGLDAVGVLLGGALGLLRFRRQGSMREILEPIEVATPLQALAVGLDPLVHRFVADLDRKDPITRDHVIRTARLSVRLASALKLHPHDVRDVGVAAILHDVGKLEIPDEILHKPDRLTADEFRIMKRHAEIGSDLLLRTRGLKASAAMVRGHHERWDGGGYPDGLAAEAIPLGARIVAVCDSFDAMCETRQYRAGMEADRVRSIMAEHAGSQWDERLVSLLWKLIDSDGLPVDSRALGNVGRGEQLGVEAVLDCCIDATATVEGGAAADAAAPPVDRGGELVGGDATVGHE